MRHRYSREAGVHSSALACVFILVACGSEQGGLELQEDDATDKTKEAGAKPLHDARRPEDSGASHMEAAADVVRMDDGFTVDDGAPEDRRGPQEDAGPLERCVFHSEPIVDPPSSEPQGAAEAGAADGGAADAAGDDPIDAAFFTGPSIAVAKSPFIGSYLTDTRGSALYIYGADLPGDCEHPPVTNCAGDCVASWPPFNAGSRELGEGLDDGVFGTLQRADGTHQTTYYGWPLYYYKKDESGTIAGQGKGSIWFGAEVTLPTVMIMRTPAETGGVKYLSDDAGRTLYALNAPEEGDEDEAPEVCAGDCLKNFEPFSRSAIAPVSSLEPSSFQVLLREDGRLQISYRDMPLFYAVGDRRSGDMAGLELPGVSLVEP